MSHRLRGGGTRGNAAGPGGRRADQHDDLDRTADDDHRAADHSRACATVDDRNDEAADGQGHAGSRAARRHSRRPDDHQRARALQGTGHLGRRL